MATKRWNEFGPMVRDHLGTARVWVRKWYPWLGTLAVALFCVGAWYSFRNLGVSLSELKVGPLLALLALAPVTIVYSGTGLWLLARSARTSIPLSRATTISTFATVAEALPLPGGAIVRASALMAVGTGAGESSMLVILSAVIWISVAFLACGVALMNHGHALAAILGLGGFAGVAASFSWLLWRAGLSNALFSLAHRVAGLVLIGVRLQFAFLSLGVSLPWGDAMPFALASVAGSAAAIAPAGLGVTELLAAMIAGSVSIAPAAAFIASGIDRIVALGASGLYALATVGIERARQAADAPE